MQGARTASGDPQRVDQYEERCAVESCGRGKATSEHIDCQIDQRGNYTDEKSVEDRGIRQRRFVEDVVALASERLGHVQLIGVEKSAAPEPCLVGEPDRVEYQRVAFPAGDRVSHVCVLGGALRIVGLAVERNHAE